MVDTLNHELTDKRPDCITFRKARTFDDELKKFFELFLHKRILRAFIVDLVRVFEGLIRLSEKFDHLRERGVVRELTFESL